MSEMTFVIAVVIAVVITSGLFRMRRVGVCSQDRVRAGGAAEYCRIKDLRGYRNTENWV